MSRRVERRFANPDQISRHLYCSICTDIFLDPTRLFCSHTFCKKCITHWTKDHNSCPICREEVQTEIMGKDLIADKMIQDLPVLCPNNPCEWKDALENLEKHSKMCSFAKAPEWLEKEQNYIRIEDEPLTIPSYWPNIKCLQHFPTINYGPINGNMYTRVAPEIYCMTFLNNMCARNPAAKEFFESIVTHTTVEARRDSTSGNYSFEIQNNIILPIEETKIETRGQDELIMIENATRHGENPSLYKKAQRKKKDLINMTERSYRNNKKGSKKLKSPATLVNEDSDENYEAKIATMPKIRKNSRKKTNRLISLVDESTDETIIKKTKAGVV